MKIITIKVQIDENNGANGASMVDATFNNTPTGIAQAMGLLCQMIEDANNEEIIGECLAEA